jgi:dipeptidyl-peptidase-3
VFFWCRDYRNTFPDEFPFIHPNDLALYKAWETKSFEVQVANHELLGHGSGKLFKEAADGKKNFNPEKVNYWTNSHPHIVT